MSNIIAVVSGKGGTGKSTFSIGLASVYNSMGSETLLIDMDEGLRCLDLMLGVSEKVVFDLADVFNLEKSIDEVAVGITDNLSLIAAPLEANSYDKSKLLEFFESLDGTYDNIILDLSAGINEDILMSLPKDTKVLVIQSLNSIGCRSAGTIEDVLYKYELVNSYLVINRFDFKFLRKNAALSLDDIVDLSGLKLIGIVPFDINLDILSKDGNLYNSSKCFEAFKRIEKRLSGKSVDLPKLKNLC